MKNEDDNELHLGKNIKEIIKSQALKFGYIAAKIGVTAPRMTEIIGQDNVSDELLAKIAEAVGVTPEFIRNWQSPKGGVFIENNNGTINGDSQVGAVTGEVGTFNAAGESTVAMIREMFNNYVDSHKEIKQRYETEIADLKAEIAKLRK